MTLSLDILAARMRQGESIPLGDTARVAVALSVPAILQQLVVTAMEYIDAAMVGHIGAEATAAIGIVSSSTWLLHGILVGLFTSFAIQIAQYLGADRQEDARGVLQQSMIFNIRSCARRWASASAGSCPGGWVRTRLCRAMLRPTLASGPQPCRSAWPWGCTPPCCGPRVTP